MQSMHHLASSLVLASFLVFGRVRACSFEKHPSQIVMASDTLRVPLSAAGAQDQCAKTAAAYGYTAATIRPSASGQQVECSVYDVTDQCVKFEMEEGAMSMTNISACDTAAVQTLSGQSLNLLTTPSETTVLSTVSASKRTNFAAIGGVAGPALKAPSEEECLFACVSYVKGCMTVTTGNVATGSVDCTFHNEEATMGVSASGSNTYDNIVTTRGTPALGNLAPARPAPPAAPKQVPVETPIETPMEVIAPATVEAPEPVIVATPPAPVAVEMPAVVVVEAPEPAVVVETPEPVEVEEESEEVETPAPAEVDPEAGAGTLEALLFTEVGDCGPVMSTIPTGKHLPLLKAPEEAVKEYGDLLSADGQLDMSYGEIQKGGEYCVSPGSTAPKVVFGGMMFWSNDGKCHLPPTKGDGSACCEMYMWQPNTGGFYYDNCSMKMAMEGDGTWWFTTEMPGDESVVGWGPDPAPHIHYDIICKGCKNSGAFGGTSYQYWSKFYAEEICTVEQCGNVNEEEHLSDKLEGPDGETVYKYNFVLPPEGK